MLINEVTWSRLYGGGLCDIFELKRIMLSKIFFIIDIAKGIKMSNILIRYELD
jgi:hypothetical protein